MVAFDEIKDPLPEVSASQERLLDAEAIEAAATTMKRPTARMHLDALAKKLRRESDALKRVESSRKAADSEDTETTNSATDKPSAPTSSDPPPAKPAPAAAPITTPANLPDKVVAPPVVSSSVRYIPIDRFAFDAGGYNSQFVTLYVDLPGVGEKRGDVSCNFTAGSFDLIVPDLKGKSYRLFKDNLEKDIDPDKSKIIVKADKVVVKLAKIKTSEFGGYDFWSKLTDTKNRKGASKGGSSAKDDPQKSIMQLMKDMYDDGDDNMKKVIGETMLKQQKGELGGSKGGLGDMDGLGDM